MNYSVTVRVTTPVNPTEVTDRVADAIRELFPTATVESRADRITATAHDLDRFRTQLFDQRILDTARTELHRNRTTAGFEFDLKKQAAFNGTVNFSVGNSDELGDIHVAVTVSEPSVEAFGAYLAPKTEGGEPIEPGESGPTDLEE